MYTYTLTICFIYTYCMYIYRERKIMLNLFLLGSFNLEVIRRDWIKLSKVGDCASWAMVALSWLNVRTWLSDKNIYEFHCRVQSLGFMEKILMWRLSYDDSSPCWAAWSKISKHKRCEKCNHGEHHWLPW